MVKEFNLSEKIQDHCDECCSEMIDIIDIKEFIKRLKDEINQFPNRDDKLGARILMPDGGGVDRFGVMNVIDELAGDKLI